jgi:ParB family chromosome partitioning protein
LRGKKLIVAKRLIEQRRRRGKELRFKGNRPKQTLSSHALIRAYREDVDRKRLLIRKAEATRNRLIFVTEAMRKPLDDENFVTLMRAEAIDTLPQNLAARIQVGGKAC